MTGRGLDWLIAFVRDPGAISPFDGMKHTSQIQHLPWHNYKYKLVFAYARFTAMIDSL